VPPPQRNRLLIPFIGLVLLLITLLAAGSYWWLKKHRVADAPLTSLMGPSESIRLDEHLSFAPGSADLRPEATRVLVSALAQLTPRTD